MEDFLEGKKEEDDDAAKSEDEKEEEEDAENADGEKTAVDIREIRYKLSLLACVRSGLQVEASFA